MPNRKHIAIIGAGVIGASIAHHLSAHAQVTVIESHAPGAGASSKSFGWINASFAETPDYHRLRVAALAAHKVLESQTGPLIRWGGSLWWEATGAAFAAQVDHLSELGYPVQVLNRAAFVALEPQIANPPDRSLLAPMEGAADGAVLARRLLQSPGITLRTGAAMTALRLSGDRVTGVVTTAGTVDVDGVVIAAGMATQGLLAPFMNLSVRGDPGLILSTRPTAPAISHLILSPGIHFRQDASGRILAGEIFSGDLGTQTAPEALVAEMMARLRDRLPGNDLVLETIRFGVRPVPADGFPVVGAIPGLIGAHVAVMHSGVTLAAIMGQLLAAEVMGQGESPLLAPFRPQRFL